MAPRGSRITMEEKGQRTARSTDVYISEAGIKEGAVCSGCRSLYMNKRWYPPDADRPEGAASSEMLCPACHRMRDNNPAGIVTYRGQYLAEHEKEILNIIKNVEEKARTKNPLARIMEIKQEGESMTVSTTDDKLAQKLGRDIYKAHSGSLEYQWSRENRFVRVNWNR